MKKFTPTIGIEVHAELKTITKMFCDSRNDPHGSEPNTNICPICLAHPGTLPVINKEAVKHIVTIGRAVGGEIASYTEFDRKNYFYPDIPKGYQISQYLYPIVKGGSLAGVAITRVHLEEDTARSNHVDGEGTTVDYNRAGVPLMELVTEPVLHSAQDAASFAKELQILLRTLGVSDANMEKGEMRVEANISISDSDTRGTKVEVKNLNSFKSVEQAILYEIKRQEDVIHVGGTVVQETRGWDESKGKTFSQRKKENADEYRYFPDPDLPKMNLTLTNDILNSRLPELPVEKRLKYSDIGLTSNQIEYLLTNPPVTHFYEMSCQFAQSVSPKLIANYLLTDLIPHFTNLIEIKNANSLHFATLMSLVSTNKITSRVAKDIIKEVVIDGHEPAALISARGLDTYSNESLLTETVDKVLAEHGNVMEEYRNGKEASLQFLIGQAMKLSKGSLNPQKLNEAFKQKST